MIADAKNEYDNDRITKTEYANRIGYPLAGYVANAIVSLTVDTVVFGVSKSVTEWILRMVTEPLAMFPFIGKAIQNELSSIVRAVSGQKKIWVDESTLDSLPLDVTNKTLNSGYQLTEGISQYIATDGESGSKQIESAIKGMVEETALLTGLPISPVRKLEKGYLAEKPEKEVRR